MVVAKHPLAALAGVEMLKKGGNAVDAAVATAFAVGVVEPFMSGLGGGGSMIIHLEGSHEDVNVDYMPRVPSKASSGLFEVEEGESGAYGWPRVKDDANIIGYRACIVPGTVSGLALAMERYGSMDLEDVLRPAIRYAEEGFEVSSYTSLCIALSMELLSRFPESARIFLREGRFPYRPCTQEPSLPADTLVQRELARTLRKLAKNGPEEFYGGEIAQAIVNDMERNGGLITAGDLVDYEARVLEPLRVDYRGLEIVTSRTHGGPTLIEILNIVEGFDLRAAGHNTATSLHYIGESMKLAFADRYKELWDPYSERVPLERLVSKEYSRKLRELLNPDTHKKTLIRGRGFGPDGGHTTCLSVVDGKRNVVSLTQTLGDLFGCGVVIADTGIVMNDGMFWFNPQLGHIASIKPDKWPLSAVTSTFVFDRGSPFLSIGAIGYRRIIGAVAQVVINVIDYGMDIQQAIGAPRIDYSTDKLIVDSRIPSSVLRRLRSKGHKILVVREELSSINFSSPSGILLDKDGKLHGGVDAFKPDNTAIGY